MRKVIPFLIIFLGVITVSSCTKTEAPPLKPINGSVIFYFDHYVGKEPVVFDEIRYTNAFGNQYSVATLKYFVSDLVLTMKDGKEIYIDVEHYVDAMDKNTLMFDPAVAIPRGEYRSVSFVFGLTNEKNINGVFPNPPENNMEWPIPLGGGYHYMKLEGKIDNAGEIKNFQAHTGPTNGNDNSIAITLPNSGFSLDDKELKLNIVMDINNWWVNPNLLDLNMMSMVMGNQEMQKKLHDNGMDVFILKVK
jgi:hypothetical protein